MDGGFKFQVHPKNVPPQIEKFGMSMAAGMQASVEIHKKTVTLRFHIVYLHKTIQISLFFFL